MALPRGQGVNNLKLNLFHPHFYGFNKLFSLLVKNKIKLRKSRLRLDMSLVSVIRSRSRSGHFLYNKIYSISDVGLGLIPIIFKIELRTKDNLF